MWVWFIVGGLFLCCCIAGIAGLLAQRDAHRLLADGVVVRGRVISLVSDIVNEDWEARVEFAIDGQIHVVGLRSWGTVQVGDEVQLACLRESPTGARRIYQGFAWKQAVGPFVIAGITATAAAVLSLLATLEWL